jgi:hypothetical protein
VFCRVEIWHTLGEGFIRRVSWRQESNGNVCVLCLGIIGPLSGGYNKEVENMKKLLCLAVVFAFVMSAAAPLYAADLPKPVDKLAKGTMDIVKSPLALYDHTKSEIDGADHKLLGFLKGAVTSPFHMVKKAGGGVMDVATFPIE